MDLINNLMMGFGTAFTPENLLYAFGGAVLGMFLTIPLLIIMVSFAGDEFHWIGVLVTCVILTLGSWVIFIWGLHLTIPLKPVFMGG